ncbi:MAG: transglutaminase family protein [Bacteroidota bacterium]
MKLKIHHHTSYQYSTQVFVEPHHLYFYPGIRSYLRLKQFEIKVDPVPDGLAQRIDAENNPYHQCWFMGQRDSFNIDVHLELEVSDYNPFDYLIEEVVRKEKLTGLAPYLNKEHLLSEDLILWINELFESVSRNKTEFISRLCSEIHGNWTHEVRYEETLYHPNDCFKAQTGSCRDLSWMMILILRYCGIPSRFVSGYSYNPEAEGHELHAWVEAWVYGPGWIGIDPSSGLFTTQFYVPVTASHHPSLTLPVQGTYRGEATSRLHTKVDLKLLD